MKQRRGRVMLSGETVGTLEQTGRSIAFQYNEEWLRRPGAVPISLTMPLGPEPFVTESYLGKEANDRYEQILRENTAILVG